ncbi:MAG: acyltransferase [Candidatus Bathyarchaeia archaeon]
MSQNPRKVNSPFQIAFQELESFHDLNAADLWKVISKDRIKARYISPFAIILYEEKTGEYPKIGKNAWIGHFCILDGSQGLAIGKSCNISCGVQIYTHSTHRRCTLELDKEKGKVKIGDHVYLGPNSIVTLDCKIDSHAMIAPLSVLTPGTHVKEYEFYAGSPAVKKGDMRDKK